MLPLPSTKYPTTQRTVIGTTDVYADDVVLNCDTSAGPVVINLGDIPADYFSTQYKLYIVDVSGNAAINNITINAGTGQTINNQANLVVSTNSSSTLILITGNTTYVALGTGLNTTPTFIPVTYVQLTNLITTGTIIPDADYLLLDAEFGSAPFLVATNVFLKGMTTKTTTITGEGIFYDADYQAIGNYSSITGFAGQLGVWKPILVTPLNSVCIWNNRHYVNISGANGLINPGLDVANWTLLTISTTNGYIQVVNSVIYNVTNNRIVYRTDLAGNQVERTVLAGVNSFNVFPFGNQAVRQNRVLSNGICNICNNLFVNTTAFFNNTITANSRVTIGQVNLPAEISSFYNNEFTDTVATFIGNSDQFNNNILFDTTFTINANSGSIQGNIFKNSTVDIASNSAFFNNNEIVNCQNFQITTLNAGKFNENYFFASLFTLSSNLTNSAEIARNRVTNGAIVNIVDNDGIIAFNNIDSESTFDITTVNSNVGAIKYVNLLNQSSFSIDTNTGQIGTSGKTRGIIVKNASVFNLKSNSGSIGGLELVNESEFRIENCTGPVEDVSMTNKSFIVIRNLLSPYYIKTFSIETTTLGNPSFDLTQNIFDFSCSKGYSNVLWLLDLSDPAIYNGGTQTLTIPLGISGVIGKAGLINAGGITISKINGLTNTRSVLFVNDNGTTTFNSVSITTPPALLDIVSPNGNFAYNIVYRTDGQDEIYLKRSGNNNVVTSSVILT